jgi:glutamyl-tRNA synthetase/nondiscriminating glutamyl-tRNA synthetase
MRFRFPPSPTGHLHVGNVRTALYNWLLARKSGGDFILRIEDTDVERSTRENEERLIRDLGWLGLDWNEGPVVEGPDAPYRQSERLHLYHERIARLLDEGKAYYCFCTPEALEAERERALAEKRPPMYSGTCRHLDPAEAKRRLAAGEQAAVRFRVEPGPAIAWNDLIHGELSVERETIGDYVFVRSDGMPAYNFAVVVDDALMHVTHVIRGDDHISNTPRQILLYEAMGFPLPLFGHLPMILGPDGSRLSKRHGATSVEEFRLRGYLPDALINFLALLGWNPGNEREIFGRDELIEAFSLERVNRSPAIFNFEKLDWLNGQYLRSTPPAELFVHLAPFLRERGFLGETEPAGEVRQWYHDLIDTCMSGATLVEVAESCRLVFEFDPAAHIGLPETKEVLETPGAVAVIEALLENLRRVDKPLDAETFKGVVEQVKTATAMKGKNLFHPVRVAITGRASGPELAKLVPLLERGARLPLPVPVTNLRERVERMLAAVKEG